MALGLVIITHRGASQRARGAGGGACPAGGGGRHRFHSGGDDAALSKAELDIAFG